MRSKESKLRHLELRPARRCGGGAGDAEVRQVRIPARPHRQPGHRGTGKVAGHRQRRAAVEGERGNQHPAAPDRHQLRHPRLRLLLQQPDRVGRPGGGSNTAWLSRGTAARASYPAQHTPPGSVAPAPTPADTAAHPGGAPAVTTLIIGSLPVSAHQPGLHDSRQWNLPPLRTGARGQPSPGRAARRAACA